MKNMWKMKEGRNELWLRHTEWMDWLRHTEHVSGHLWDIYYVTVNQYLKVTRRTRFPFTSAVTRHMYHTPFHLMKETTQKCGSTRHQKVETSHYSWTKSFNRLTSDQNSDRKQYYYWQYYLHQTAQNQEYSERAGTVIVYQMRTPEIRSSRCHCRLSKVAKRWTK